MQNMKYKEERQNNNCWTRKAKYEIQNKKCYIENTWTWTNTKKSIWSTKYKLAWMSSSWGWEANGDDDDDDDDDDDEDHHQMWSEVRGWREVIEWSPASSTTSCSCRSHCDHHHHDDGGEHNNDGDDDEDDNDDDQVEILLLMMMIKLYQAI